MRLFFAIVVSAAALLAADPQAKKDATPAKSADGSKPLAKPADGSKSADASKPLAIPAGAVETPDGYFHYTDPEGKKWIYHKSPFGVARVEETAGDAREKVSRVDTSALIKATEAGDTVRFERLGPFGVWKWEKKKSDLDESETAALENARAAKAPHADRASKQAEKASKQE